MTFALLSKAYNSISPAATAFFLGLPNHGDDVIQNLVAEGWEYDSENGLLKPLVKYASVTSGSELKDERIGELTALVTHLTEV